MGGGGDLNRWGSSALTGQGGPAVLSPGASPRADIWSPFRGPGYEVIQAFTGYRLGLSSGPLSGDLGYEVIQAFAGYRPGLSFGPLAGSRVQR